MIDILETWGWGKALERAAKTRCGLSSGEGLSCMPPTPYARRFIARVIAQLIEGYEPPTDPLPLAEEASLLAHMQGHAGGDLDADGLLQWVSVDDCDPSVDFNRWQAQLARQRLVWSQREAHPWSLAAAAATVAAAAPPPAPSPPLAPAGLGVH